MARKHTQQRYHARQDAPLAQGRIDTEAGMLSGVSRKRSIRSSPCWFTEFCNSQCLSHFAAPFIVVRAETSVAESCVRKQYADERHRGTKLRWSQRDGSRGRRGAPRKRRPRSWAKAMKTVRPSPATARHHTGASYAHAPEKGTRAPPSPQAPHQPRFTWYSDFACE